MFFFKNIASSDMKIYCQDEDFLGKASLTYNEIYIEGKDGLDYEILNYNNYEKNVTMFLRDTSKLDQVLSWLNGKGEFRYNGKKTIAYFLDAVETSDLFEKAYKIKCRFIRHPFWYSTNDDFIPVDDIIYNEGTIYSKPIIKIKGTGQVDMSINDVRFKYSFDNDQEVHIDCLNMSEEYNGSQKSQNIEIGFNYPILYPGENRITIHSGNVEIYVKRKDAWL